MKTTFIYSLNDPISGKCRYVGMALSPKTRLRKHISRAKESNTHKNNWIRSLINVGRKPTLEILDEVLAEQGGFFEREYIRVFRAIGFDLVNGTAGGDGGNTGTGRKDSPERTAQRRARRHSPEVRARISAGNSGENHWAFGTKRSEESNAKTSATLAAGKHVPWNKGLKRAIIT